MQNLDGISVDTHAVEAMMERLMLNDKEGEKIVKHACRLALEVINEETGVQASQLNLKDSGKGWRKMMTKVRSSYIYRTRRIFSGGFFFYTAVNYKKPVLRISHLIEKGFRHLFSGNVRGFWFRKEAFEKKRHETLRTLENNLRVGMTLRAENTKAPTLSQFRKAVNK